MENTQALEEEKYLPHGSMSKMAKELKGKITYKTIKNYFNGDSMSIDTIELIESVKDKYYKTRKKAS